MGNCMKPSATQRKVEEQGREMEGDDAVKVKIVLTKEELEWLIFELKVNKGKKLQDVVLEIQRERDQREKLSKAWKPSLESILESPERSLDEFMTQ